MEGEEDKVLAFDEVQFLFSVKCDKDIFRKNTLVFWWGVESFPGVFQGIIITRTETHIYYIANSPGYCHLCVTSFNPTSSMRWDLGSGMSCA